MEDVQRSRHTPTSRWSQWRSEPHQTSAAHWVKSTNTCIASTPSSVVAIRAGRTLCDTTSRWTKCLSNYPKVSPPLSSHSARQAKNKTNGSIHKLNVFTCLAYPPRESERERCPYKMHIHTHTLPSYYDVNACVRSFGGSSGRAADAQLCNRSIGERTCVTVRWCDETGAKLCKQASEVVIVTRRWGGGRGERWTLGRIR